MKRPLGNAGRPSVCVGMGAGRANGSGVAEEHVGEARQNRGRVRMNDQGRA